MAARARSGVGCWMLTSFPPKENQRADRHGNHGDRHQREGTVTCMWPKPPGGDAPRDQHRRPEQEDPNRQVEGGLTEGRKGSLLSSLPRDERSRREVDRERRQKDKQRVEVERGHDRHGREKTAGPRQESQPDVSVRAMHDYPRRRGLGDGCSGLVRSRLLDAHPRLARTTPPTTSGITATTTRVPKWEFGWPGAQNRVTLLTAETAAFQRLKAMVAEKNHLMPTRL